MDDWLQYLIGGVATILGGGGLVAFLNWFNSRRKLKSEIAFTQADTENKEADTAEIITRAAGAVTTMFKKQFEILRSENETMRCQIKVLQEENTALKGIQEEHEKKILGLQAIAEQFDMVVDGAHVLYGQVVEMNGQPKYKPPERRKRDKT